MCCSRYKVSVIITTFRRDAKLLERAINSVLNQSYKNYELIVVNDNGLKSEYTEKVNKVIDEIVTDKEIKLIHNDINIGAPASRNRGVKESKGDFIAFLDDDDEWMPKKLELQISKFKTQKKYEKKLGLVSCWHYYIKEINEKNHIIRIKKPKIGYKDVQKVLLRKNIIGSTSFSLIKKKCIEEVGGFDEELPAKQDYDLWLKISEKYAFDFVNTPLCKYYAHNDYRITTDNSKKLKAEILFLNKHYNLINSDRKAYSIKNRLIGVYYYKKKMHNEAREHFIKSVRRNPFELKSYFYLFKLAINR